MPKYQVGDIAALFPKPKEAKTEGGKKLQSLFTEFHTKGNKPVFQGQQQQKKSETGNEDFKNSKKDTEPQSFQASKGKKRKNSFSDVKSNIKKVMKKINLETDIPNEAEALKVPEKGKNSSLFNVDFPRRKNKAKFNRNFNTMATEDFPAKQNNKFNLKSNYPQRNNGPEPANRSQQANQPQQAKRPQQTKSFQPANGPQQVKSFIKKAKHIKFDDSNGKIENFQIAVPETPQQLNYKVANRLQQAKQPQQANRFQEANNSQQVKSFIKKAKHNKFNASNDTIENLQIAATESPQLPKYKVVDNNSLLKSRNENQGVKNPKKKKKKRQNAGMPEMSNETSFKGIVKQNDPNQLDFIEVPGIKAKDNKEELSRTLFVGNLPTNTTRKALIKLFSVFGVVEKIRYHPIETKKSRIFKSGGSKLTNLNYAATSIPGFVIFKEREDAAKALSLSGTVFAKHHITVDFALPSGTKKEYDKNRSIFIGNLSFDTEDESIWNAFAECGRIEGVRLIKDRSTGIGKGFGYVLFHSVQSMENALALKYVKVQDRVIRIKAVDYNKKTQKKSDKPVIKNIKRDTFKSKAIKMKKSRGVTSSRKSITKIMKKNKNLHQKKKISSLLQKVMK